MSRVATAAPVVSFRREAFVPKAGLTAETADMEGNVVVVADPQLSSLIDYRYITLKPHEAYTEKRPQAWCGRRGP